MTADSLDARFAAAMGRCLGPDFPTDIALAVSGGGDSMAMLALAHGWARVWGVRLWVVTVDHGLRPEAAGEAAMVAAECATLGHPHATLRWHRPPDAPGNLMQAARQARLALIDRWRGPLRHVLFAHTADDVAETFLMRLARGSGVDGLAAMADRRRVSPHRGPAPRLATAEVAGAMPPDAGATAVSGFDVIRPLLDMRRAALRHHIRVLQVPWVDDPTNADPAFERARLRGWLAAADTPLDIDAIAESARRLRRARAALAARAADLARTAGRPALPGTLSFDRDALAAADRETVLRLLSGALRWVADAEHGPRAAPLEALADRVLAGGRGSLHGAEAEAGRETLTVWRDMNAVAELAEPAGPSSLWDGRWRLDGPGTGGLEIRALGEEGWAQARALARASGADLPGPMRIARSLPALWDGGRLAACAGLGVGPRHRAADLGPGDFAQFLLSD